MIVQAEVSLYPLGEADPAREIDAFVRRIARSGLTVETGPLSTLVSGESGLVFRALEEAYAANAEGERRVMIVKMKNAP